MKKEKVCWQNASITYFETNKTQRASSDQEEVLGVIIHQTMMEELFQFDLSTSNYKVDFNVKQLQVDALLANFQKSMNYTFGQSRNN